MCEGESDSKAGDVNVMMNVAVRVASIVFIIYITYLSQPGTSLFSWHPFLMALAFSGLMAEGVAMFSNHGIATGKPHSTKLTAHWTLLLAAGVCHGLGYAAIYYTKEEKNKPHLTSWHGYIGLLTSILLWCQLCAGILSKYPKFVKGFVTLRLLRACHSLSGCLTLGLGMLTICLALFSSWFEGNGNNYLLYLAITLHLLLFAIPFSRHVRKYIWAK